MSKKGVILLAVAAALIAQTSQTQAKTSGQDPSLLNIATASIAEPQAKTMATPRQILRSGIDLTKIQLSPNSIQLANKLQLTPVLRKIALLRANTSADDQPVTLQTLSRRQDLTEAVQQGQQIILDADLAVDFTISEILAEIGINHELLATYQAQANHAVSMCNWTSYYSNGALWAVAEALTIPSAKRPKYAISSGINGIIAGAIPSIFSSRAMRVAGGRNHPGQREPNMLTKLFGLKTELEDEFPEQVWAYLDTVPASQINGNKTRRSLLIDRWVADQNIHGFTDRNSSKQIELVSAAVETQKGVTIELLQTRAIMLAQLAGEVMKMKRLLFELSLAVSGKKHI